MGIKRRRIPRLEIKKTSSGAGALYVTPHLATKDGMRILVVGLVLVLVVGGKRAREMGRRSLPGEGRGGEAKAVWSLAHSALGTGWFFWGGASSQIVRCGDHCAWKRHRVPVQ